MIHLHVLAGQFAEAVAASMPTESVVAACSSAAKSRHTLKVLQVMHNCNTLFHNMQDLKKLTAELPSSSSFLASTTKSA